MDSEKYLIQVDVIRRLRGKTQAEIQNNSEIIKNLPSPDKEEEKILEEEGLGGNDEPATAVFIAANALYSKDPSFREALAKMENDYAASTNAFM